MAENLLHDHHSHLESVTIAPGETGSFEVFLNTKRLFSKHERDRFPEIDEVEAMVGKLLEP